MPPVSNGVGGGIRTLRKFVLYQSTLYQDYLTMRDLTQFSQPEYLYWAPPQTNTLPFCYVTNQFLFPVIC